MSYRFFARDKNPATLNLLNFLTEREGLDNVEVRDFYPPPGFINPEPDQIVWSGRDWELIKDFCPITGEFSDFLLWNCRECCGVRIEIDEWLGWESDEQVEDIQTELVSAIAAFENQSNPDANVQLSLFEVAA